MSVKMVLILVLMEDTLRDCQKSKEQQFVLHLVLILVLMEDTLRDVLQIKFKMQYFSLNPCFNGRYSQRALC